MENSTFSIIVPVYNVEKYICRCIDSILVQTFSDFELLLIDDGSTDRSGRICDEYAEKDTRIKVIHKPNSGVSTTRNIGIDHAKGKFICFVDSDDWIENDYLQHIKDEMYDFDILFFGSIWHYEDGSSRSLCLHEFDCKTELHEAIFYLLKNNTKINYYGFTWNKVFRRDIIERFGIRFVDQLSISEDEVFTLAYCIHIQSLKIIESPLYHYLWKMQGLTHSKRKRVDWLLLADSLLKLLSEIKDKELTLYYKTRIANIYNIAALSSNDLCSFIKDELKMIKYCVKNNVSLPIKAIGKGIIKKMA